MKDATVYCKLDLFKAYLHVEVDDKSKDIQVISTHKGTYRMNRLSLDIKTAPGQFNQIFARVLSGLEGVLWYFDDIVIFGKNYEECLHNLLACLQRLQNNNLHLNMEKCLFFKTRIAYLGFIIEGQKIRKDPRKISAIVNAKRPSSYKEVKQFLGLVTHYSRFIPNASTITFPIRQLLSKNCQFKWTCACGSA